MWAYPIAIARFAVASTGSIEKDRNLRYQRCEYLLNRAIVTWNKQFPLDRIVSFVERSARIDNPH
ncbi:MAG: hypothetical protein IE884_06310 [Sulfuricurvum sp.]|nr:hypothetical protein [Sulfuricurvum sp.]